MNKNRSFTGKNIWVLFFGLSVLLLLLTSPCHALFGGKIDSFTADNVEIGPDGKVINTSKFYMTPDAMRIDGMPGQGRPGAPALNLTMLVLKKQDKQYIYNHDKKLVFESPVDKDNLTAGYQAMDNVESEKILGKEKVSGYKCVKKEVITSYSAMGQTFKDKMIVWESDRFEFPLKTMDDEGAVQEMRNIKPGKPSKKVFKPLTGYKKADSMMAAMGMNFGAVMAGEAADDDKPESAPAIPAPPENMNMEAMMAQMQQSMGQDMSPEQKAQMMQAMALAMNQASQIKEGPGAADDLWKVIPRHSKDQIGSETSMANTIDVQLGSQSSLGQVFGFYKKKLSAKGWQDGGTYLQGSQGTMSMTKNGQRLMFASTEDPDMPGSFKSFYNIHYSRP